MKPLVCKICTMRLAEAAYGHAWWFRLVRVPLRLAMLLMGWLYRVDVSAYDVRSPECRGCPRMVKLELKERSALFRLLNSLVNPHFDRLMDSLTAEAERQAAKDFAERAVRGRGESENENEKNP